MRSLAREDVPLGVSGQSFALLSHLLSVISSSRLAAFRRLLLYKSNYYLFINLKLNSHSVLEIYRLNLFLLTQGY